jgi:cob(I)alamin adenosyltransferase
MKHKGLILIYIGTGKGKTTAAVGLAARAVGAGRTVLFTQFVKSASAQAPGEWPQSSEITVLKRLPQTKVKIFGKGFVGILGDNKSLISHIQAARTGLRWLKNQIAKKRFQIIIADELITAIELNLLTVEEVKSLFRFCHQFEALVLTGHKKYNKLIQSADVVTEMKMIKHPYYKGLIAQKGIDF